MLCSSSPLVAGSGWGRASRDGGSVSSSHNRLRGCLRAVRRALTRFYPLIIRFLAPKSFSSQPAPGRPPARAVDIAAGLVSLIAESAARDHARVARAGIRGLPQPAILPFPAAMRNWIRDLGAADDLLAGCAPDPREQSRLGHGPPCQQSRPSATGHRGPSIRRAVGPGR